MVNIITGGAGFLGQHLAIALSARGEPVRIVDLMPPRDLSTGAGTQIEFVQASVTDPSALTRACNGATCVFHMAANAHLWAKDKSVYQSVNADGTRNALTAAEHVGAKTFVYTSSLTTLIGRQHAQRLEAVDESAVFAPRDLLGPYPKSKRMAENTVLDAAAKGMHAVIGLPTMPVGPGDYGLTGPTKMILDYLNGKTPAFVNTRMNFIDVRDLAEAHIAMRDRGQPGERYILGGNNLWMADMLSSLEHVSGVKMPSTKVPYHLALAVAVINEAWADRISRKPPVAPLTGVRIAGRWLDFQTGKAMRELGLSVRPFRDSLQDLVAWFKDQGLLSS